MLNKAALCPVSDLANSGSRLQNRVIRRRIFGHRPKSVWSTNAMQITVVAVMCHTLGAVVAQSIGTLDQPYCREVVVIRQCRHACFPNQRSPTGRPTRFIRAITGVSNASSASRATMCPRSGFRSKRLSTAGRLSKAGPSFRGWMLRPRSFRPRQGPCSLGIGR